MPPGATGPVPLAVIFSASGTTDRNGNNFSIPGKNDSLRQLASGLASEGVATFRFDKRGSGEAYPLGRDETELRFDQYIQDGIAVLSRFADDPRFTRRMAIGHAEGGLVAAAAFNRIDDAETLLDALVLLCPTGKSPLATVEESLADTPGEHVREARAIMEALRRGARYPEPSEYFAGFFRPSFQGYLSSWFAYDPVVEVVAARIPVILVRGARDIHIREEDFRILADARPSASAFVVPGMNHALKEVSGDEDDNYDSFTDPDRKLGAGLVQLLAAIAHVRPVPATIRRFGR